MGGGSAQDQVFQALLFCINYAQYLTGIHFFFFFFLNVITNIFIPTDNYHK